ncbi:hypothetical protein [Rhizobium leguminosarum]|uniref:hypothetical protein n=1 Tax=Rhizobium leguminosarum TaxID=384 RepID=UPI0003F6CECE|nr:hypothetical protein [Rhizobium leguminosarum]
MRKSLKIDTFRLTKLETAFSALNAAALRANESYNVTIKDRVAVQAEISRLKDALVNPRGHEAELKTDLQLASAKLDEINNRLDHLRAKQKAAFEEGNATGLVLEACERFLRSLKKHKAPFFEPGMR